MKMQKPKRISFNTTINEEIANDFREYCKTVNVPMNLVLEIFMTQFIQGQFTFKLTRTGMKMELEE